MYSGERPSIDAMAPRIPSNLVDSAVALGALTPADTAIYIFAPAGQGNARCLHRHHPRVRGALGGTFKHYLIAHDYSLSLRLNPDGGFLVIADTATGVADTIYRTLAGQEQRALLQALSTALRRDST